jgi:hypothetical protein
MKLCLFKKVVQILSALAAANVLMLAPVYAQSSTAQTEITEDQQLLATATKTPQVLLSDLERHERAFYLLFNSLNSSDNNDIICHSVPATNSDANRQLCKPIFFEEIKQEVDAELAQNGKKRTGFFVRIRNIFQSPEDRAEQLLREKARVPVELLQQEIESLATVHPNLLAQLTTIGELQHEYLQLVQAEQRKDNYLMGQNKSSYNHSGFGQSRPVAPRLTLSAPPPGYTQPTLNYGYQGSLAR